MPTIDLNCDLGEGAGQDGALMPLITSANIACGGHAGDMETMRATLRLAKKAGVSAGAHPGYEDRARFGRVEIPMRPEAVHDLVARQIATLNRLAAEEGVSLTHVKPHGALYNLAARDEEVAGAVAAAVREAGVHLVLFGLSGSVLLAAGRRAGLAVASEVFADRAYREDGALLPRSQPGAVHRDGEVMIAQVLDLVLRGRVRTAGGSEVPVQADTLCLHGDGEQAAAFARRIRQTLLDAGAAVAPVAK